jgi:hypothetical protein
MIDHTDYSSEFMRLSGLIEDLLYELDNDENASQADKDAASEAFKILWDRVPTEF